MVIWIIGLSGAGKTTLATEVYSKTKRSVPNTVLVDGDVIREVFGNDLGYTIDDRMRNADRISRLCKYLDEQGINVICAILSIFKESRAWNRNNIKNYYEVFIDVPVEDLIKRDPKGIYKKYFSGELIDVPGLDIDFPKPENADLVIDNTGTDALLLEYAEDLANVIAGRNN